ncbi:MAG: dTDP-4-dehydrorhamnose 3,5-epimerase [Flavobacteriaceae bacterium]|uniref:dTDP-4-dehydrorhamnose 3,5-epimerase n=1 Tax=Flagellimonas sp. SN16 TaxID=3415142 RepID=UPI003C4C0DE9|nr:dTDP-4-dehydrorhamnose 3,5-epimerase [Flavobacteriaceae bacterium]
MKAIETKLKGCFILEPQVFEDDRGYFFESYNHEAFCNAIGMEVVFVQDNFSFSKKGVLRGLHYQKGEHAQSKLVSVLEGKVQDVVVDIRKDSPTYGQHISIELSSDNKKQLFVPRGFAHGFLVLSETAHFFYKCDNYYNKEAEEGIRYDDATLGIDWNVGLNKPFLSKRDSSLYQFM